MGGISLRPGDEVVEMVVVESGVTNMTLLTVCENGFGKRTPVSDYRLQRRNGGGTINIRVTARNGRVVGMKPVTDEHDVVLITRGGIIIRTPVSEIRSIGRATQGVRVMSLRHDDQLITVERVARDDPEETSAEGTDDGAAPFDAPDAPDAPEVQPGAAGDGESTELGAPGETGGEPEMEREDQSGEDGAEDAADERDRDGN